MVLSHGPDPKPLTPPTIRRFPLDQLRTPKSFSGEVHYEQLWNTGRDDDDDDSIDGRSRVSGAVAGVRDPRVSSQTTAAAGDRGNPSRDFRTSRGARAGQSLDMGASAAPGPASLPPSQLINKVRKRNISKEFISIAVLTVYLTLNS